MLNKITKDSLITAPAITIEYSNVFRPSWIVIHNSATKDGIAVDWKAIREYHIKVNGWSDIGYHFGVEVVGSEVVVEKGRTTDKVGAHAKGFNTKSIGICLVGNYDLTEPELFKLLPLVALVKKVQYCFDIPTEHIIGHREVYPLLKEPVLKTCPGTKFDMADFRNAVNMVKLI